MTQRTSLKVQHKNPHHDKVMQARLEDFLSIIRKEEQEEVAKI